MSWSTWSNRHRPASTSGGSCVEGVEHEGVVGVGAVAELEGDGGVGHGVRMVRNPPMPPGYSETMHVITPRRCREFWAVHPDAEAALRAWLRSTQAADWGSIAEVKADFPAADAVPLAGRPTATIFNIGGNKYRLAALVLYRSGRVYVKRIMTHAEYDKNHWHGDFRPADRGDRL